MLTPEEILERDCQLCHFSHNIYVDSNTSIEKRVKKIDESLELATEISVYRSLLATKGGLLVKSGKYFEAEKCLDEALGYDEVFYYSTDLSLRYFKFIIKVAYKHWNEALDYINTLIEEYVPEYNYSLLQESMMYKSIILYNLERYEEGLEFIDKAIEYIPENDLFWFKKARMLLDLDRYYEALDVVDKLLERNSDIGLWRLKGNILMDLNRLEDALTAFEKTSELNPDDMNAWLCRSLTYYLLSRVEDAKWAYKMAEKIDSQNEALIQMKNQVYTMLYSN